MASEQEAYEEWDLRQNDHYWLSIASVQLIPGTKVGIGQSICFQFQAHGFTQSLNENTGMHDFKYTGDL